MFEATQINRKNLGREKISRFVLGGMTAILILPVILIMSTLIYKGAPVISFDFLFTNPTNGMTQGGIFPALLGTILLVIVALLASVPLGVAAAIYANMRRITGSLAQLTSPLLTSQAYRLSFMPCLAWVHLSSSSALEPVSWRPALRWLS